MSEFTISDFRKAMRNGPYTWPGSYPLFFLLSDGEALSFESAQKERRNILEAIRDQDDSGWRVVAVDVNWEDEDMFCCHSGKKIESAYGSDGGEND